MMRVGSLEHAGRRLWEKFVDFNDEGSKEESIALTL